MKADPKPPQVRAVDSRTLRPGDRVFTPSMGTAYLVGEAGNVSFSPMGFAPITGSWWTVETNTETTIAVRRDGGDLMTYPHPAEAIDRRVLAAID